jgi:diguanylate cyclase (GGDEF)-like protein/PAS domain S-box-containing protein
MSKPSVDNQPDSPRDVPSAGGTAPSSFYEKLLESLHDGVYFVDQERRITYWNQGAERLTGYGRAEAVGRNCFDNFLAHVDDAGCSLCFDGCPLAATLVDGERRQNEIYLRHKLGYRVPVSVRVAPIRDDAGRIVGAVEVFSDISAKKNIERRASELEGLAFRDSLTGVPNRRYIGLKVEQAVQEIHQFDRKIGLLMVDIDKFKQVNDRHGHDIGDLVLKMVSNTLSHNLRPGDVLGRWGGEEFLVLAMDVTVGTLATFAERCRRLIAESSVPISDQRLQVTVSVGATLLQTGDSAESAIKRADELMYRSKNSGRNQTTLG